ncbi:hypothetical protein CEXT_643661, partial [Caerostris extrusa]
MEHAFSYQAAVQRAPHYRVPMRDWDPEGKMKLYLICFLGVSIAIVVWLFFNHFLYENTSTLYVEHNIIAAVCTGVAACLVLCVVILYLRRDRIRPGMLRFWERITVLQRQQERPDQRHENIEMQQNLVQEADPELGQQNREVMQRTPQMKQPGRSNEEMKQAISNKSY